MDVPDLPWVEPPSVPVETSELAADAIKPKAKTLRRLVLRFIEARGYVGATDQEIAAALDLPENTARPRRYELAQADFIRKQGRRKTTSGRWADVWVIKVKGGQCTYA